LFSQRFDRQRATMLKKLIKQKMKKQKQKQKKCHRQPSRDGVQCWGEELSFKLISLACQSSRRKDNAPGNLIYRKNFELPDPVPFFIITNITLSRHLQSVSFCKVKRQPKF
jgi:hypothetical protein